MKLRIRIQGFAIFAASVLLILLAKLIIPTWKAELSDDLSDILGIVIILLGFFIRIVSRGTKADNSSSGQTLCTNGPYQLTRHPMYLGTFFIGLGSILVLLQFWVAIILSIVLAFIYLPTIKKEEKKLSGLFGEEYLAYCQSTPLFLPYPWSLFKINLGQWLPCKWSWVKKELPSIGGTLLLVLVLEIWEDYMIFGEWEHFEELAKMVIITAIFFCLILCSNKQK